MYELTLVLALVAAGACAVAALLTALGTRRARTAVAAAGVLLLVWIATQAVVVGYTGPAQIAFALLGVVLVALGAVKRYFETTRAL